ncbi:c-type cytochrome [Winogradskyella tangerina]|uniref:c-type cytochrome n=1 Tax=Winogradskyella tangerina TaxID=2023240 RepID=UPI001E2A749E|nr:cytochrome c [Winogradskyella tangerina]
MIRILRLATVMLLITSCNSKEKKSTKVEYPEKTTFSNQSPELKASMAKGKLVYDSLCITCHMADGKGAPQVFPPLANSDYLENNQEESIIGIKNGMKGEMVVNGITYNSLMSPLGLSDEEVADVMNYINNSWGNKYGKYLTTEEVTNVIKK